MERETPTPSGADDRLSGSVDRSTRPEDRLRLVESVLTGSAGPDPDELEDTRSLLEQYQTAYGMPLELFDISVDEMSERRLAKSTWAGVVRIALDPSSTSIHPSMGSFVASRLTGRTPNVRVNQDYLTADFQMEDGEYDSRMRAADFAYTLALLLGGLPERVSVSQYKAPYGDNASTREPPSV